MNKRKAKKAIKKRYGFNKTKWPGNIPAKILDKAIQHYTRMYFDGLNREIFYADDRVYIEAERGVV